MLHLFVCLLFVFLDAICAYVSEKAPKPSSHLLRVSKKKKTSGSRRRRLCLRFVSEPAPSIFEASGRQPSTTKKQTQVHQAIDDKQTSKRKHTHKRKPRGRKPKTSKQHTHKSPATSQEDNKQNNCSEARGDYFANVILQTTTTVIMSKATQLLEPTQVFATYPHNILLDLREK